MLMKRAEALSQRNEDQQHTSSGFLSFPRMNERSIEATRLDPKSVALPNDASEV